MSMNAFYSLCFLLFTHRKKIKADKAFALNTAGAGEVVDGEAAGQGETVSAGGGADPFGLGALGGMGGMGGLGGMGMPPGVTPEQYQKMMKVGGVEEGGGGGE